MTTNEMSMITAADEHDFQFASKQRAQLAARIETVRTGHKHQAFLTTTYRDLTPRICWYVCLSLAWKNGKLVTA